ncbi:MAG: AtpZ/AtpI family protein [Candidatus Uhrbacteria bacterium]|nr:AtpZ/AtpI family protein [Candidatus Uhrbacteria bacterium]
MDKPSRQKSLLSGYRAMGFVWEVLISIAVPTTLFALGGRWLDLRWHTSPLFLGTGLLLSLVVAGALVIHQAKRFTDTLHD